MSGDGRDGTIQIHASHTTIRDVTIDGANLGVKLSTLVFGNNEPRQGVRACRAYNVVVTNSTRYGIKIQSDSSDVLGVGCHAEAHPAEGLEAIWLGTPGTTQPRNCGFVNCTSKNNQMGLHFHFAIDCFMTDCTVISSRQWGAVDADGVGNRWIGNRFEMDSEPEGSDHGVLVQFESGERG